MLFSFCYCCNRTRLSLTSLPIIYSGKKSFAFIWCKAVYRWYLGNDTSWWVFSLQLLWQLLWCTASSQINLGNATVKSLGESVPILLKYCIWVQLRGPFSDFWSSMYTSLNKKKWLPSNCCWPIRPGLYSYLCNIKWCDTANIKRTIEFGNLCWACI